MAQTTGMAPPPEDEKDWLFVFTFFLPSYVGASSRGYALCLRPTLTEERQKPLDFSPSGVSLWYTTGNKIWAASVHIL